MNETKYKHTELGPIPEHWEMHKLGHFLILFSEKGFPDAQLLSVTREQGVILRERDNKEENHNFVPDDLSGYKHLRKGDFVINKMKSWQGSYGVSNYEGIVSPAYFTCKLKGVNPDFFSRAIRCRTYSAYFMKFSKGIRVDQWDLDPIALKYIPFALPPLDEQEAMVAYLDEQTGKIDAAIEREQKMIDLLNERKQIIIQQAVTKGLNPNVPMKDSGIDWIGEIPQSWKSIRLKYCMKIRNGQDYKHCVADFGYPVYGSGGQFAYASQYMYDGEVVFFGRKGTIDKPLYYKGKFWAVDTMFYAIPKKNIIGRFLYYAGRTIPFKYYSTSTALPSMTQTDLGNNPIALPPIEEQQNIVSYLDGKMGNIDRAIEAREKLISLLRERKQIIINEVVTGKIKVS